MSQYFKNIAVTIKTLSAGLRLTLTHFFDARKSRKPIGIQDPTYFEADRGTFTLQYPHESIPVPDNGRYRLHNEIDDCIVCDKCAKICPVDCIEIEPIKAAETFGTTSDGTPKRIYAAKFDIDMAKCCFCGLCTTVCPTECLTMTKVYDFSEFDVKDHIYSFADMSLSEIALRKQEEQEMIRQKEEKTAALTPKPGAVRPKTGAVKPVLPKPSASISPKPVVSESAGEGKKEEESGEAEASKPKFRPRPMIKRKTKDDE